MDRSSEIDLSDLADPSEDGEPEPAVRLPIDGLPDQSAAVAAEVAAQRAYIEAVRAMAGRLETPGVAVAVFKSCWGEPLEGRTRLELRLYDRKHRGASTVVVSGNDLDAIEEMARAALDDVRSGRGDDVVVYQLRAAGTRVRVWRRA